MVKEENVVIPEYVVLTSDRENFESEFSNALGGLCSNYEKIMQIEDLADVIPENVQEINLEPVNSFIDERISEILSTKMLTLDAKERSKREWEDIRKKAVPLITSIRNFFERYPIAKVVLVGERFKVVNSYEVKFEACKKPVPQQLVTKHYELIQNVRNAIDALWEFERANDWPSDNILNVELDLEQIGHPEKLAQNWVFRAWQKEYRKQHPYLDGAYAIATKSSLADQNARLSEARKKHLAEHPEDFVEIRKQNPYENMRSSSLDYSVEMK